MKTFGGRVRFVSENWGDSKLADRYNVTRYPVVFVGDVLFARPDDLGGFGRNDGKYAPIQDSKKQAKFKEDLARMIDVVLQGGDSAALQAVEVRSGKAELSALPNFSWTDLDGKPISSSELTGRAVVVEFWATWCPPCRATLHRLDDIKKRYGDRVAVLAVAVESDEAETKRIARTFKTPVRFIRGTNDIVATFGTLTNVPTLFVFDQQGKTATVFYGTSSDLHVKVNRLLDSLVK